MDILRNTLHTYLFFIPVIVLLLSEALKHILDWWRTGVITERLFQPGGMPSTHSAFVTSLLTLIWQKLGVESVEFAIAFVFACIIWYDAMGARRALGEQAKILNTLQHWQHLAERLGHSFSEVLGGILFGAAVTWIGILFS